MNRITIEPGALPNQWDHIWLHDFTTILTTTTDSPYINDADVHFLNTCHVNPHTNSGGENIKDSDVLAQPTPKRLSPTPPGECPAFYSDSEKESQRRDLAARRIQHQTESNPQPSFGHPISQYNEDGSLAEEQ